MGIVFGAVPCSSAPPTLTPLSHPALKSTELLKVVRSALAKARRARGCGRGAELRPQDLRPQPWRGDGRGSAAQRRPQGRREASAHGQSGHFGGLPSPFPYEECGGFGLLYLLYSSMIFVYASSVSSHARPTSLPTTANNPEPRPRAHRQDCHAALSSVLLLYHHLLRYVRPNTPPGCRAVGKPVARGISAAPAPLPPPPTCLAASRLDRVVLPAVLPHL